jgi:hypothetical protein
MPTLVVSVPGEYGEAGEPVLHEACGIRWDANDVLRFLSKCGWESFERPDGMIGRHLVWRGAKSRGGPNRKAGRKAGNKKWYGSFSVKGKTVRAHKFAAVAILGLRPGPGDELDHNCYHTLCVSCLEQVTREVNQARIRRSPSARGTGSVKGKLSASPSSGANFAPGRHDRGGQHSDTTDRTPEG